ncbi:MAG: 3'-5' exonuclease [Bdellovibrionales bacterium]|nr:3'-5' exonuclease [Bdellovibrionales bacterium]
MDFVALDVETTGTLSYTDRIVELAAVRFVNGKIEDRFSTLINPGVTMPEEASRVNGITDEMLKDQPDIADVLKDFSNFCAEHVLVAHNAIFDFQFLCVALEKCYFTGPRGPLFDTYLLSKKIFPGLSNYKLSTIVEYLKIPVSHFHRAEQDAWSCGEVFNVILSRIKSVENGPFDFSKLNQITGKKELRFPPLKAHQLSLFE